MIAPLRIICEPDPTAALLAWQAAIDSDDVTAIIDPRWPVAVMQAASDAVTMAHRQGRFAPRDLVLFTSGSSGVPRAVHRSRSSWELSSEAFAQVLDYRGDDLLAVLGPVSSSLFAFAAWHVHVCGVGSVAVPPSELAAHPDSPQISVVHAVPAMVATILSAVESRRLPALRTMVVAGDVVPAAAFAQASHLGVRLIEYYGAAELSLVGIHERPGPLLAFPGVEVDVRCDKLWSRSPFHMVDYLEPAPAPARNSLAERHIGPFATDESGWASVGDLASSQGEGFSIRGRGGSAITTGGHTVVAEEVERFLLGLTGVRAAAVTGVPHARLGQRLVALVDADLDDNQLREACLALPRAARPRGWLRGQVPRTGTGKIAREQVAQLAAAAAAPR